VKLLARRGTPLAAQARAAGLEVRELEFGSRFHPGRDLRDARAIASLARESPVGALIHCHRGKDHWCAQAARSLLGLRSTLLRSRHVVLPVGGGPLNRWLYRRAARVVCVSEAARAGYLASGRLPAARAVVIPSGSADLDRFRPPDEARRRAARRELGFVPEERVAVLVGRLQRIKGQRVFLRAAARVAEENTSAGFLLVGGGKGREGLEALVRETGLEQRARLLGRREDVPRLLAACDLGVVASLGSEGFSRAALEYMATALPVVATRVGALPEIVVHGRTGLLVPPGEPRPLAAAMGRLLADERLARDMGRAGRQRAEAVYSREAWLAAHEELYAECLADSRPPA
jgi:glycosyltransferase involved in cell wall biosynthesis